MSDPENFLARWSRRKQDVAKQTAKEQTGPDDVKLPVAAKDVESPPAKTPAAETVDLGKLPSLEEITAESDITAFLRPGVPADLARAALRRAWSSDPAVRDFVGLQENDWVFNRPGADQGFGPLGPEHDVGKLLAQVFGESAEADAASAKEPKAPPAADLAAQTALGAETGGKPAASPATPAEPSADRVAAAHNESAAQPKRVHGGALPHPISET